MPLKTFAKSYIIFFFFIFGSEGNGDEQLVSKSCIDNHVQMRNVSLPVIYVPQNYIFVISIEF